MDELFLEAYQHATAFDGSWQDEVHLVYSEREKSRYRTTTEAARTSAGSCPGTVLCDGDALVCEQRDRSRARGQRVPDRGFSSDDPHLLLRAAYHLGNRHVSLQILPGRLRFPRDHVLEEMLEGLGLTVRAVDDAFTPEAGAYALAQPRASRHA
jgi:urease accessory protein